MEIIPSILVSTEQELKNKLSLVQGLVERVHLDIADGIFVPNTTIDGYSQLAKIETNIAITAHLMVSKPENHIANWVDSIVDQVIFHIEATNDPQRVIDMAKEGDLQVGVALKPETPCDEISSIVDQIDFVHFMTVEPGFYGADFVQDVVEKIQDFKFMYPDIPIQVDGGITDQTAPALVEAGVTNFVVGSFLFDNKKLSIEEAVHQLQKAIE